MLLTESIDRLAAFEPVPFPVISLYLDMRPDQTGRDRYEPFLRKTFRERLQTFRASSPEHESFSRDVERITAWLAGNVRPSANGLAIFACAGADEFFEAVQLDVPIEEHRLYVDDQPHVYPLARLDDQFPRYAAVVLDTHLARIFVFGTGERQHAETIEGQKTKRLKVGGWSQARYQRHMGNFHHQHVKEVIDTLERIVRSERIPSIVFAGDDEAVALVRQHLTPELADRVVDVIRLDINAPERDVLSATLDVLRRKDAETDAERVEQLLGAVRSSGLGVLGAEATLEALQKGQVDELLITARPDLLTNVDAVVPDTAAAPPQHTGSVETGLAAVDNRAEQSTTATSSVPAEEKAADRIVTLARQTDARIRFIEDPALLAEVGGVGALLRFTL